MYTGKTKALEKSVIQRKSMVYFSCLAQKSRFSLFPHIPYNSIMLGVVRHFSRVAHCFSATNRLPVDLSQNWTLKKCEKSTKQFQCRIFLYAARVSAFTRCSLRRKQLDFGMLAEVGKQFSFFHHQLGWSPKSIVFVSGDNLWPQKPKVDSFRKGKNQLEQLWGSRWLICIWVVDHEPGDHQ